jgi:hypothetical protein
LIAPVPSGTSNGPLTAKATPRDGLIIFQGLQGATAKSIKSLRPQAFASAFGSSGRHPYALRERGTHPESKMRSQGAQWLLTFLTARRTWHAFAERLRHRSNNLTAFVRRPIGERALQRAATPRSPKQVRYRTAFCLGLSGMFPALFRHTSHRVMSGMTSPPRAASLTFRTANRPRAKVHVTHGRVRRRSNIARRKL